MKLYRLAKELDPNIVVTCEGEAIALLRMLNRDKPLANAAYEKDTIIRALIKWIKEREQQIDDIKFGATHLLLQAAQTVGERDSAGH